MYGPILTEAPEGFVPYHQWPEYGLEADVPPFLGPRKVGKSPVGMYRRIWPIVVEEYVSDTEPVLADSDPHKIALNRAIVWQRIFRQDAPQGWRNLTQRDPQLEGFALLDSQNYTARWSESARRYLRKWQKEYLGRDYAVEPVSVEEFNAAYMKSSVQKDIKEMFKHILLRKASGGAGIEIWAVRHLPSRTLAAAMAYVTSPTHNASYYLCGFVSPTHEHVPAMVALVDAWHARGLERGMRFLHFGRFWKEGDPEDWKGFSQFKSKFGLQYIAYQPALWRFVRGRLF